MSEINNWSYKLESFIKNNKLENKLTIISCIEECKNCELKLIIDNNNLKILTNFKNYCYVESSLYNASELNQDILYLNKYNSLENIINAIIEFKYNNIDSDYINKIKYTDKYHFYNKLDEKTKFKINYTELETITKNSKISTNLLSINISKELLLNNNQIYQLNNNQIYQLIITEIKKINSNFDYKHIIQPIDNNIFSLKITLFLQNINVDIKVTLNNKLYPFYPPEFELISPKVKLPLYFAIINLNITKIKNWNSAISLEWIITNLALKLDLIIDNYIDNSQSFNNLEFALLKLLNITKESNNNNLNIDLDIQTIPIVKNKKNILNSGTGYSTSYNKDNWNITNYIKEKEILQLETCNILKVINELLNNDNLLLIKDSCLLKYILNITKGINLLEIENECLIFNEIIKLLSNIKLFNNFSNVINNDFINELIDNLQSTNDEIIMLFKNNDELHNNELYQGLYNIYQIYSELIINKNDLKNLKLDYTESELYCNIMKPQQFIICDLLTDHKYYNKINIKPEPSTMKRIVSEIGSFKSGLPLNYDSSIWIRISKTNMCLFTFLISGPKDTPYENGLFLFNAYLPHNYPQAEPNVLLVTTGNGSVRFNPNLYNSGKVCLSLLGTWAGQESEKWNSKTSTFLQVLISIQSLILIDEPYFNEPGYQNQMSTELGKQSSKLYNNNIKYENIRWAMINQIKNPPSGYEDVIKNHFKLKKNDIINKVNKWVEELDEVKNKIKDKMITEITILTELLNNL